MHFGENVKLMEIIIVCIIIALLVLAVLDLTVGVGNDAVNFISAAIGSHAAAYRTVIITACLGMFAGAAMSNGMMDVARNGIFCPEYFSFYDILCICMAVMVTNIIMLDVFNSLGMPTSTTVSMVSALLGASFAVASVRMMTTNPELHFADMLNTDKALPVIMGIFLSVAAAFFFGVIVQYISRLVFSFNYTSHLKWKAGIFGGIATTAIIYFLLIKGVKEMVFMTADASQWIHSHTLVIILGCFIVATAVMQVLHSLGVNVFKVIVLMGTFALAMAFAANDLVNFIGVPLTGLSAWQDFSASGSHDVHGYMMDSLNTSADTPALILAIAGGVMVISLVLSRNARRVVRTSVSLGRQDVGDEIFGSSHISRRLVRGFLLASSWTSANMPQKMRRLISRRFDTSQAIMPDGAAFDLIRGSVNLVLAAALIALGTSMHLPLSTTYVTFMVAMGTSLADMAWKRESAVFRITGVMSVIGGWFITAAAAFLCAAVLAVMLHLCGYWLMLVAAIGAFVVFARRGRYSQDAVAEEPTDAMFQTIVTSPDKQQAWELLQLYITSQQTRFIAYAKDTYLAITDGFVNEDSKALNQAEHSLIKEKTRLKNIRRKETLCLSHINRDTAVEKSAWFHLAYNCIMGISYNLRRMAEVCREHVDNNFLPLPTRYRRDLSYVRAEAIAILEASTGVLEVNVQAETDELRRRCDVVKDIIAARCNRVYDSLNDGDAADMTVSYVYLNLLQESQEMLSNLRKLLRASAKLKSQPERQERQA